MIKIFLSRSRFQMGHSLIAEELEELWAMAELIYLLVC